MVSLLLETDGCAPFAAAFHPIHSGNAASVVAANRILLQHLHTGTIHKRDPVYDPHAAAARDVSCPQVVGPDLELAPAVAAAILGSFAPLIGCRGKNRQLSVSLACQIKLLCAIPSIQPIHSDPPPPALPHGYCLPCIHPDRLPADHSYRMRA